jgi:hypothetical protein
MWGWTVSHLLWATNQLQIRTRGHYSSTKWNWKILIESTWTNFDPLCSSRWALFLTSILSDRAMIRIPMDSLIGRWLHASWRSDGLLEIAAYQLMMIRKGERRDWTEFCGVYHRESTNHRWLSCKAWAISDGSRVALIRIIQLAEKKREE